jgi:hypothetical protein
MASQAFIALLNEKIERLRYSFKQSANQIFYDSNGKLIHPGEYGTYREAVVREFLRSFVPGRLSIGTGFIINSLGDISAQSDVVIYDAANTPMLENDEKQRLFPVETVCGVGEVKSDVDRTNLKTAFQKLAKVKEIRRGIQNPVPIKRDYARDHGRLAHPFDQIPTFLICQRFDFDLADFPAETEAWYDASSPREFRHNMVLSIEDGLLLYFDDNSKSIMYPTFNGKILLPRFVKPVENPVVHFHLFCSYIFMLTSSCTIFYPEITDYMPSVFGAMNINAQIESEQAGEAKPDPDLS